MINAISYITWNRKINNKNQEGFNINVKEIISDAVHYPLSDIKKFLILGLPNLILTIVLFILFFEINGLDAVSNLPVEELISTAEFSNFIIVTVIFLIITVLWILVIEGIGLSIIRNTINGTDELPSIKIGQNIIDGIKVVITQIAYFIIPAILYILLFVSITAESVGLTVVLFIVFIAVFVCLAFLQYTAISRLAETGSISEALKIKEINTITKNIGYRKIFSVMIFISVISYIISLISLLLEEIPIIGTFIAMFILYTFALIVNYRGIGLLYRERNNSTENIRQNNIDFSQINNNEINNISSDENNSVDFKTEESHAAKDSVNQNLKKCSECGFSNPDYTNICVNCGKELI